MPQTITVSSDNWTWLQSLARPLEDTVDDVLDRLRSSATTGTVPTSQSNFRPQGLQRRASRERLGKGLKVPAEEFRRPILLTLRAMGGRGRPKDVLPEVERRLKHLFRDVDYERLGGGAIRWEKTANWVRRELVLEGLIDGSKFGYWALTDKGRAAIPVDQSTEQE